MLPDECNAVTCSLVPGEPRLAVTLNVVMNENGIVSSAYNYGRSLIKNHARLSYESANVLINDLEEEGKSNSILKGEYPEGTENFLKSSLKQLFAITKKRNEFRR